jgi:hypothetical protein
MDIVDGGMLLGEKIQLTTAKTRAQKLDRKSARSGRKNRARLALKQREVDKVTILKIFS